jgi:hypothetical protein
MPQPEGPTPGRKRLLHTLPGARAVRSRTRPRSRSYIRQQRGSCETTGLQTITANRSTERVVLARPHHRPARQQACSRAVHSAASPVSKGPSSPKQPIDQVATTSAATRPDFTPGRASPHGRPGTTPNMGRSFLADGGPPPTVPKYQARLLARLKASRRPPRAGHPAPPGRQGPGTARATPRPARPPAGRGDGRPGPRHPRRRRRAPPPRSTADPCAPGRPPRRRSARPAETPRAAGRGSVGAQDRAAVGAHSQAVSAHCSASTCPPANRSIHPPRPGPWTGSPSDQGRQTRSAATIPGQVVNFNVGGARSSGPGGRAARVLLVSRL